jgi:hypothetical protein
MIRNSILIIGFVAVQLITAHAQDLSATTTVWKANKLMELPSGALTLSPGVIVLDHLQRVELKGNDGTVQKTYTLADQFGDLQDAGQAGRVRFSISSTQNDLGVIVFERRGDVINVHISLNGANSQLTEYYYDIESIEVQ